MSHLVVVLAGILVVSAPVLAGTLPLTPPFTEAPPVGADTSAEFLLMIQSDGSLALAVDTTQGPFDQTEDTLYAVVNLSSSTVLLNPTPGLPGLRHFRFRWGWPMSGLSFRGKK